LFLWLSFFFFPLEFEGKKKLLLLYCFFILKVLDRYQQDCEKLREISWQQTVLGRGQTAEKVKLITDDTMATFMRFPIIIHNPKSAVLFDSES
jgi:hypothetical protein